MKTLLIAALLLGLCAAGATAQSIYADLTVSTGTPPSTTPLGTFRVLLHHDKAPRTVANFIGLATGRRAWVDPVTGAVRRTPFYDGLIFHRLEHAFVIQGGSPFGASGGIPGFFIQDEFHPDLRHDGRYILSMAKGSLPHTANSGFFITLAAAPGLDDKHSVFGEVVDGKSIIDDFSNPVIHPTTGTAPVTRINIDSVVISGPGYPGFDLFDPALLLPEVLEQAISTVSYNPDTDFFRMDWPHHRQHFYNVQTAVSPGSLSPLYYTYAPTDFPDEFLAIAGITAPRQFGRVTAIDYSLLTDAPSDVASAGKRLEIHDRNGNTLTLDFTGTGGGNWSHSDSSSGSFSVFFLTSDRRFTPGVTVETSSYPALIPLYRLYVTLSPAAGPQGWTAIDVELNFLSPTTGHVEGFSNIGPIQQFFTYTP